jgi:hypothetical protein
MTSLALKVLALVAMTIDHIGFHLVWSPVWYPLCRAVGRLAMPLFCFLIAQGYRHSKNRLRYLFRLLGFALSIELCLVVLWLVEGSNYLLEVNIFLTLSAGLSCLMLLKSTNSSYRWGGVLLLAALSFAPFDYGLYGILLIILFGLTDRFHHYLFGLFALNILFIELPIYLPLDLNPHFFRLQWLSLLALIPIYYYNGKPGPNGYKSFFYLYYPLHLLVILGIKALLL